MIREAELTMNRSAPPSPSQQPVKSDIALSVRNLRTEFHTGEGIFPAVRDVSFDIRRGCQLGIVGESGSGKSALALSILGLVRPPGRIVAGEVRLNGKNLRAMDEASLSRVRGKEMSLIFQDPMTALDPVKTVGTQIMECILHHNRGMSRRNARKRAARLLDDVEIPNAAQRLDSYPHQFSGGMRQRVMIAIAIANEPDLIVADEPTTALDVTTQAQILDVFERLVRSSGTTVILITHNLGIVAEFCDEVHVMYAGRIVESASTKEIFRLPGHPYTESLLKSVPRPEEARRGRLFSVAGFPPSLARLPPGCSFEPRCFAGRGLPQCRSEPPGAIWAGKKESRRLVECHLANQRLEEALAE